MILTKCQRKEFEEAAKPLIEFLNNNCHPHVTVIVETNRAELSEGVCAFVCNDYIKN